MRRVAVAGAVTAVLLTSAATITSSPAHADPVAAAVADDSITRPTSSAASRGVFRGPTVTARPMLGPPAPVHVGAGTVRAAAVAKKTRPAVARPARVAVKSRSTRVTHAPAKSSHQPRRVRHQVPKRTVRHPARRPSYGVGRFAAAVAYAYAQIGKPYVSNAAGPRAFDCSGLTMRAYARAGLRLPHSSGAQAARARSIPLSQARPGDLVVGPGHVGIYIGHGMMIDAGNHRTGVIKRRLYAGLHVERFN